MNDFFIKMLVIILFYFVLYVVYLYVIAKANSDGLTTRHNKGDSSMSPPPPFSDDKLSEENKHLRRHLKVTRDLSTYAVRNITSIAQDVNNCDISDADFREMVKFQVKRFSQNCKSNLD